MIQKYITALKYNSYWRNKNTVIIKVMGGLGNQLFQYAFAKALEKTLNKIVMLDAHSFYQGNNPYKRVYLLSNFRIQVKEASKQIINTLPNKKISYIDHNNKKYDIISCFKELKPPGYKYASGYWQSAEIINLCRKELVNDIQLTQKPSSKFYALMNDIKICKNSTAIHFRQSWNLDAPEIQKPHENKITNSVHSQNPLTIEYYEQGIINIKRDKKDTKFFIFADDIKKAKEIIDKIIPTSEYYVIPHRHNNIYDCEDLLLMSEYSNFVMSNSTFSWWGAWLSWARTQDKQNNSIYIMPHDWSANGSGEKTSEELTFSSSIIHL